MVELDEDEEEAVVGALISRRRMCLVGHNQHPSMEITPQTAEHRGVEGGAEEDEVLDEAMVL